MQCRCIPAAEVIHRDISLVDALECDNWVEAVQRIVSGISGYRKLRFCISRAMRWMVKQKYFVLRLVWAVEKKNMRQAMKWPNNVKLLRCISATRRPWEFCKSGKKCRSQKINLVGRGVGSILWCRESPFSMQLVYFRASEKSVKKFQ